MIMLSSAYQMSSADTKRQKADPSNRLLSRFNRARLTVEEMRDSLLASMARSISTMGGTLQSGFGTDGENSDDG